VFEYSIDVGSEKIAFSEENQTKILKHVIYNDFKDTDGVIYIIEELKPLTDLEVAVLQTGSDIRYRGFKD